MFAWKLKLKGQKEWDEWRKSGMRPSNIPSNPDKTYGDEFTSYPDFLGYERRKAPPGSTNMRPFKAARAFVRKLKLKSQKEWREWSKSGMRPTNIPSDPHKVYGDEFTSMPDLLGYAPKRGAGGSRSSSASSSSSSSSSAASTGPKKSKKRKHGPTTAGAPNTPSASIPRSSIKVKVEKTVKEEDTNNDDDSHHDHSRKRTRH